MKVMKMFIYLILLSGCTPSDSIVEPIVPEDTVQVLWNQKIFENNSNGFTSPFIFSNNSLVFSTLYFGPNNTIQSRNINTGILNWELNDPKLGQDNSGEYNIGIYNKTLYWKDNKSLIEIDLGAGHITQESKVGENSISPYMNILEDILYTSSRDKSIQQIDNYFLRKHINSQIWDTLTIITKEDGFTKFIKMANLFIDNSEDSLLLFTVGKWNFPESRGQTDFYCLSLKDRTVKWRLKDWDKDGSSIYAPIIYQGKVYFQGHHTLYCIDIESGNQLWKYVMPEYLHTLLQCQPLIADNKLFLKSNDVTLYALNPQTGTLVWKNANTEYETQKLQYANGMVMFTSHHYLMVINARTGATIWKKKSPFEDAEANFNGWIPIGVNEKDSIIYACDKKNIMAIKMPELK